MKRRRVLFAGVFAGLVLAAVAWAGISEMADLMLQAFDARKPFPNVSQIEPTLDIKVAFEVQKAYNQKLLARDRIAGFKGGLTTEAAQKTFGVNHPVPGVLFVSGLREGSPVIQTSDFNTLMLETEVAFVIGEPISGTVKDVAGLQKKIRGAMPSIELPNLALADMKNIKAVDIIASNVTAKQFIVGTEKKLEGMDPNQVQVVLTHNGQVVNQGKGTDALGDQWKAALWLVNIMVEQGYRIEPGHILMTGALGRMIPGKPGSYVADFGTLGKISFEIK